MSFNLILLLIVIGIILLAIAFYIQRYYFVMGFVTNHANNGLYSSSSLHRSDLKERVVNI